MLILSKPDNVNLIETRLLFQRDADEFFDRERNYLVEYHTHIREATQKADKTCRLRRSGF